MPSSYPESPSGLVRSGEPIPLTSPTTGLVSVVVLCCGQVEHTRFCAPSIVRFSRSPFEVIAVDAGSLDGTADYWAGIQAAATVRVEIVRSPAAVDLPAALAEGLTRTKGEFIVLLNNDTIVSDGWLTQLVALAGTSPTVGMVAPMATFGPGPQVVWPVPYRLGSKAGVPMGYDEIREQVDAVDRFARDWRDKHRGQWSEEPRLGGGCILLRRTALQAIGPPPGASLQFFDPEAMSVRLKEAGFRLACCRDLFVHSFGSRGFVASTPAK